MFRTFWHPGIVEWIFDLLYINVVGLQTVPTRLSLF